jgi:hypothetical protein
VLLWALLFVIVLDMGVDTLALVPSQTIYFQKGRNQKHESSIGRERQKSLRRNFPLIPSQVLVKSNSLKLSATTVVQDGDACSEKQDMQVKPTTKRKRKRSNKKKKISPLRSNQQTKANPTTGNWPDIFSGAIPMDHLRQHPNYRPLPEYVSNIRCLEDVRFFRQDSWQWEALHKGERRLRRQLPHWDF